MRSEWQFTQGRRSAKVFPDADKRVLICFEDSRRVVEASGRFSSLSAAKRAGRKFVMEGVKK